jgi:amidase
VAPPVSMAHSADVFERLILGYFGPSMPQDVREASKAVAAMPRGDDEPALLRGARAIAQDLAQHLETVEERAQLRGAWHAFFESYDLLLCPVFNVPAFPHQLEGDITSRELDVDGHTLPHLELFRWCGIFNATYLPSASVPAGRTAGGLPVGVQVVGPYLEDLTVLRAATAIDRILDAYESPPAI